MADDAVPDAAIRVEEGWAPRPPEAVLRPSRLERARVRALGRLADRRPRVHGLARAVQHANRRAVDALVPGRRIRPLLIAAIGLTVFDALATMVVVGSGLAVEANPLLADVVADLGLAPAMALRAVVGGALVWALAWLSTWRAEVRPALLLVAIVLAGVAVLHVVGTLLAVLLS